MLQQPAQEPVARIDVAAETEPWAEGSETSSDSPDDAELPPCKVKRNYRCSKCAFCTQNPRAYLTHARDAHDENVKIYECPKCVYASRRQHKLLRHIKMVHAASNKYDSATGKRLEAALDAETAPAPLHVDEDDDDGVEEIEDMEEDSTPPPADAEMATESGEAATLQCARCDFVGGDRGELLKHERAHRRQMYFSCAKCQYVTHIKSRFTKHVKYHSMPMIKCALCDFRTPYKWNLDRHMKNHGGGGKFCCCMCNFTADIKQSLTVHEINHHTPPVGLYVASRRRNKVGASDLVATAASAAAAAEAEDALLVKDEGSTDSQSDLESSYDNTTEMASMTMESNGVAAMELCQSQDDSGINSADAHRSFQNVCSALESLRQSRKPRPIPKLIPLNSSTPTQTSARTSPTEPPLKRFKDMFSGNVDLDILNYSSTDIFKVDRLPEDLSAPMSSSPVMNAASAPRKKNSFFDKLKERLLTETGASGTLVCKDCGFESKCLSEHSVHENNCTSHNKSIIPNASLTSSGSTRCQNCRHRCKSSADLYVHMQTCKNTVPGLEPPTVRAKLNTEDIGMSSQDEADQPHPMENVVFVWNTLSNEQAQAKLESPLNITLPDDSSADMGPRSYDPNNVDALHDNEAEGLSPSQTVGKKVFKCPHCPFWASTASRFHVHIVGHLNKKPFECSLCNYKSNWRWDITKHIRLKSVRDPDHNSAKVLMTDETGRRNYSKYSKYLATLSPNEEIKASSHAMHRKQMQDAAVNVDEPDIMSASSNDNSGVLSIMPLDLQTHKNEDPNETATKKSKKTLWKCKKCNYKNPSKEALLEHVREHSGKSLTSETEDINAATLQTKKTDKEEFPALAYQCGHCSQLSNWKHVIQRHCRLKHNGVIKVVPVERPKTDNQLNLSDIPTEGCSKCPFKATDKKLLLNHMQQHVPSPHSIFKCYFCPYFVKTESDLMQHLLLHGVSDPDEYVSKAMGGMPPLPEPILPVKRHKCTDCPYETNSKSQYMYHEQFHRLPANTPYKCQVCNYSVTKRHLLHQHMKVHGLTIKKEPLEPEVFHITSGLLPGTNTTITIKTDDSAGEIPYVWVSAKNEFHKMYKCRYCSYVNSQQCKIPNHEKIHCIWYDNDTAIYKCLECKFTCDSAVRLGEHSKIHGEIYGRIYCPVESNVSDEEQIAQLRQLLEEEKQFLLESLTKKEETSENDVDMEKTPEAGKTLYFCKKCPSRFFGDSEWMLHNKFHELKFCVQCKICSFTVPQESQMASHTYVHSDDYQAKTKMLQVMHETHPAYPQPKIVSIQFAATEEPIWIVIDDNNTASVLSNHSINGPSTSRKSDTASRGSNKHYACDHCPAKFFKTSALSYHTSLHGGPGSHTCKKCDYTVKNIGNLVKHEMIHENKDLNTTNEHKVEFDSGDDMDFKNVPLSGTDLFQRKTEAQKRVNSDKLIMRPNDHFPPVLQADPQFGYLMHGNPEFIYPTYLKNGRQKEKRYKCHKCPSAFEKREQYKVHLSLHGSKQRYKCELCDYSVKYYANYVQHMRKHQMNAEAHAEREQPSETDQGEPQPGQVSTENHDDNNIKLAIKSIPKYTAKSDFLQFSIGDQQTLRLLQRRRSSVSSSKEAGPTEPTPEKENKHLHCCAYCPYTNQRKDAVQNHLKRHTCVYGTEGNYECTHCDFSCNQSHFLRDHLKIHFNFKNAKPQCFVRHEDVILTITKLESDEQNMEIKFADTEKQEEAYSKAADKIFVHPSSGEIAV